MDKWLKELELHKVIRELFAEEDKQGRAFAETLNKLNGDEVEYLLNTGGCVKKLAEKLKPALSKLAEHASQARSGRAHESEDKFVQPSGSALAYGQLSSYFDGLEGVVGPPSVSLQEAIEREHCGSVDSHDKWRAGLERWTERRTSHRFHLQQPPAHSPAPSQSQVYRAKLWHEDKLLCRVPLCALRRRRDRNPDARAPEIEGTSPRG
jgi:hypothetical protein